MRGTVHYAKIKHTAKRRATCEICGKHFNRQRTFTQTVNPFNKNPDGSVKTFMEVLAAVQVNAAMWEPYPDCGKHAHIDPAGGAS
jgi:hypothetical protein